MTKLKLKKDDQVVVIAGADKGKRGKILAIDENNGRVIVEGVNKKIKFYKDQQDKANSGLIEIERPFDISNVMYFCDSCKKGIRVGKKDKSRICKKCEKSLD